jgi:hypothetical protein
MTQHFSELRSGVGPDRAYFRQRQQGQIRRQTRHLRGGEPSDGAESSTDQRGEWS